MTVGDTPPVGLKRDDPRNEPDLSPGRGRLDKRRAILTAALRVFAREGYSQASIEVIATEAGVAKPTIYNHFGGKENLFRQVLAETAALANVKTMAALDTFPTNPTDRAALEDELREVAHRLVDCYCDERSIAVRRLLYAEVTRFPDLFQTVRASGPNQFIQALAGRLAVLAHAGHLRITDPVRAATQFIALVCEELPMRIALSGQPLDAEEVQSVVAAGVDTFVRAFGNPRTESTSDS